MIAILSHSHIPVPELHSAHSHSQWISMRKWETEIPVYPMQTSTLYIGYMYIATANCKEIADCVNDRSVIASLCAAPLTRVFEILNA